MRVAQQRAFIILLAALAASPGLGARTIGPSMTEFHQMYNLSRTGRVLIHNLYGDVRITAWDRDEVLVEIGRASCRERV